MDFMTAPEAANAETVRKLYDEALNQNRPELLPELLTEDIVFHSTTEEQGMAAYQAMTGLRVAFGDMRFTIHDLIASGDRVVVRWSMTANHQGPLAGIPATGKPIQQRANVIYRMEGGKIAEGWAQMDQIGVLRQLGVDPLANAKAN
jgi:steroid delta-isomerase-like uncharacterized protein